MISYTPFWNTMEAQGMTQYRLIKDHGIDCGLLHRLRHNVYTSLYTLERLCRILNCGVEDVVEIIND